MLDLKMPNKALELSRDRFGWKYGYKFVEGYTTMDFSKDEINLDFENKTAWVNPKTELNSGDIFHHGLTAICQSEVQQRRAKVFPNDNKYFAGIHDSYFYYGTVLKRNEWIHKWYNDWLGFTVPDIEGALKRDAKFREGATTMENLFEESCTPLASRAMDVYITRSNFATLDEAIYGNENHHGLRDSDYKEIVAFLKEGGWPIKFVHSKKIPYELEKAVENVLKRANIASGVPVGDFSVDAIYVVTSIKKLELTDLFAWADLMMKILDKKRRYESLYDPRSSGYDPFDGPNMVEATARIHEAFSVGERMYMERAIALEEDEKI
jgi:hypothetical protein